MAIPFVLVHGGATTGAYWDRLVDHLPGPALAPDLPGRRDRPADLATLTVDDAAAAVVEDVEGAGFDEIVLVAHSSGGLEVPAVVGALGPERVRAIVLNAASVPPEGGCGLDCMQPRHREAAVAALEAARAAGTTLEAPRPERERLRTSSGEDLDDDLLDFVADPRRCVPDSFNLYLTPVHWSRTVPVPVTYVVNLRDRAVPPDLQREMAGRVPHGADVVELGSGHLAAVTHPEALAGLVAAAAEVAVGGEGAAS